MPKITLFLDLIYLQLLFLFALAGFQLTIANAKSCFSEIHRPGAVQMLCLYGNKNNTIKENRWWTSPREFPFFCVFLRKKISCVIIIWSFCSVLDPNFFGLGTKKVKERRETCEKKNFFRVKIKTSNSVIITCMHNFLISLDGRAFFLR